LSVGLDLFVKTKYELSTMILLVGIRYSMIWPTMWPQ